MKLFFRHTKRTARIATRHETRRMRFPLTFCLVALGAMAWAQETNLSVMATQVKGAQRGRIENLSIVDGRLCFQCDGFMLSSPIAHKTAQGCDVDVNLRGIDERMDYVTRNPLTGQLYYTKPTKTFRETKTTLYGYDAERRKATRVSLGGYDGEVVHPTFSSDGTTMVFASQATGGMGGYDLWFCLWDGETWGTPQPLGSNVNSEADETTPCISGEYLYFSSNREQGDSGRFDLFACRLVSAEKVHGDTIFRFPIGKGKVQRLMQPFNSARENCELAYDASQGCGFYVARDARDYDRLYSFAGSIASVRLAGKAECYYLWSSGENAAAKANGEKASNMEPVEIAVYDATRPHSTPVYTTQSGKDGSYRLYLQPNGKYNVAFSQAGAFRATLAVETKHENADNIVEDKHENVRLDCLRTNHEYAFPREAFFAHPVATDLSKEGEAFVQQAAQFLIDNPKLRLYVTCVYTERDTAFNQLLCFAREDAIEQLLWRQGVPARVLNNAVFETVFEAGGENDHVNAVLLFFETPAEKRAATTDSRMKRRRLNDFLNNEATDAAQPAVDEHDNANAAPKGETPAINTDEEPSKPSEAFQKMLETGKFEMKQ